MEYSSCVKNWAKLLIRLFSFTSQKAHLMSEAPKEESK